MIKTLADLVAINSVNPQWGGPGEAEAAQYVLNFFSQQGIETWTQEVLPNRPNVYAKLPGRDPNRRIVLEAHLDTVSAAGMSIEPFQPLVHDGNVYGRGSCDVKAGLAAMMHAVNDIHRSGEKPACETWLAAVIDEESEYRGVLSLIDELSADPSVMTEAAVVAEPTECRIATCNKGVLRWNIRTIGKTAHSSKPDLGQNAITDMMLIIKVLQEYSGRSVELNHPLVGSPTLCVSLIEGGSQINFVPDRCQISVDRRLIPGEQALAVLEHYKRLLDQIPEIAFEFPAPILADDAMETAESEAVVRNARRVAEMVKLDAAPRGVPFGCDASKLSRAGIPAIIFGPGNIDQAHADVEFVSAQQVELATDFYRTLITEFGR